VIDFTPLNDEDMRDIARLPALRAVRASETRLTDRGLGYLVTSQTLNELHILGTDVTDAGIMQLQSLQQLI